jgi:phosphoribosylanthranilate isomerase
VPVKVKICGVRTVDDASAAVRHGADFIGLNFHPPSPRSVSVEEAITIAAAVDGTPLVGVFVDASRGRVEEVAGRVGLWGLQFHGDEPPAWCRGWDRPTIKAIRARPGVDLPGLAAAYATDYILLDSFVAGLPGGTGVALDPAAARGLPVDRLFVAGGLRADTVAQVVRLLRPFAVDVASGVEREPGIKDHDEIARFIDCAKTA